MLGSGVFAERNDAGGFSVPPPAKAAEVVVQVADYIGSIVARRNTGVTLLFTYRHGRVLQF